MIKHQTTAVAEGYCRPEQIPVDMGYRKDFPLEVRFRFRDENGSVEWMMARDLLANGMLRKQGEGDILIDPSDDGVVRLTLRVLTEHLVIAFNSDDLYRFLVATYTEVAEGHEWPTVGNALDEFLSNPENFKEAH